MNSQRVVVMAGTLVVVVAGLFGLMGRAFCRATLHVPRLITARPAGAETVELIAQDKAVLKGWWFRSGSSANCVIVLHGIGDSKSGSSGFAPMFLSSGYAVLAPDSRAHGEAGGVPRNECTLGMFDAIIADDRGALRPSVHSSLGQPYNARNVAKCAKQFQH